MAAPLSAAQIAKMEADGKAYLAGFKTPTPIPAYGSNVQGFDPNNAQHVQLANAGQQWATANAAGDKAGMSAAAAAGQQIRNGIAGSTYDSSKGVTALPNAPAPTVTPSQTPTAAPVSSQQSYQPPTYTPPANTGLNFDQAKGQVAGQIDPMFARALEALQAQKHQDQLNGDQLGMARGGAHSGLAADLQNKVGIAAAGKASDLDATRQTQIAQMAQDLVNRGQDNDFRNKQQALAEYLGLNQLDLQKQGQQADYTGIFNGMQTMQSKNADRGYGLDLAGLSGQLPGGGQTLASQNQSFNQGMANKQFDYNVAIDSRDFDYKKAQDAWNQTFQKEQYNDQKAARLWEQTFKTKSFEQDMKDAAASRGLQWASLNQRDKEFIADSAYRDKTFKANQDQQKLDNTYRENKPETGNFNLDDFKGYINQNYYKDVTIPDPSVPFGPGKTVKQFDSANARKYIIGQNLPDAQTDQLLKLYGLPTG